MGFKKIQNSNQVPGKQALFFRLMRSQMFHYCPFFSKMQKTLIIRGYFKSPRNNIYIEFDLYTPF
jgi:hypothetical protein